MAKRRSDAGALLPALVGAAKGLAHPARLRLVGMLATGELCVCQLTAVLGLAPSTVSAHLSVLARGGLVAERKEGKLVFYRLRADGPGGALLGPVLERLAPDASAVADRAEIARLRRIPITTLCAADLDLVAVGVRRPPAASAGTAVPRAGR